MSQAAFREACAASEAQKQAAIAAANKTFGAELTLLHMRRPSSGGSTRRMAEIAAQEHEKRAALAEARDRAIAAAEHAHAERVQQAARLHGVASEIGGAALGVR